MFCVDGETRLELASSLHFRDDSVHKSVLTYDFFLPLKVSIHYTDGFLTSFFRFVGKSNVDNVVV